MKRFVSVCVFCLAGTAAAMGSGSGGGGGGSAASNPQQQEVGASAFKAYNQGVDLMYVRKFAVAQIKFEQAIGDNPNFAEAHNNVGFTLRQQGPQNYAKALQPKMPETYE
jgi:hypothetical protein